MRLRGGPGSKNASNGSPKASAPNSFHMPINVKAEVGDKSTNFCSPFAGNTAKFEQKPTKFSRGFRFPSRGGEQFHSSSYTILVPSDCRKTDSFIRLVPLIIEDVSLIIVVLFIIIRLKHKISHFWVGFLNDESSNGTVYYMNCYHQF
jgi:hypothetical protein